MNINTAELFAPVYNRAFKSIMNHTKERWTFPGGRASCKSSFISICVVILIVLFPSYNAVIVRKHKNTLRYSVFEQIVSGAGLLFRRHILDLREDGHRFGAVMNVLQVVVVERRVVREERRQYAFDRETAAHGAVVVVPFLERRQQIPDIL